MLCATGAEALQMSYLTWKLAIGDTRAGRGQGRTCSIFVLTVLPASPQQECVSQEASGETPGRTATGHQALRGCAGSSQVNHGAGSLRRTPRGQLARSGVWAAFMSIPEYQKGKAGDSSQPRGSSKIRPRALGSGAQWAGPEPRAAVVQDREETKPPNTPFAFQALEVCSAITQARPRARTLSVTG